MPTIHGVYTMEQWNETTGRDLPPPHKCAQVEAHGPVTGDFEGQAQSFFFIAYVSEKEGPYTGYTYFDGAIGDLKGGFVCADDGTFDPEAATSRWTIIPGSGTGGLSGIKGTGGFRATTGLTVDITLDYEIEG